MKNQFLEIAKERTKAINKMEEKIARELFDCSFDELDYDDQEYVIYEVSDRLAI